MPQFPASSTIPRSPPRPQLPDPDKPPIPYTLGQQITVRSHKPPPPLGPPHYPTRRPKPPANFQELTQLQYCVSNPPMQGSVGDKVFSFVVTRALAVRDGHGAQVIVVNGNLVAKIYDPLYYPALDDYTGRRADVVQMADCDYSREAAVYEEIRELWGTTAANYHGSWTFNISTDTASGVVTRSIRLILIEFVDGVCMRDLEPNQLTEEQRSNIMVKVIEAETALTFRGGVRHRDLAPRNIICSGGDLNSPQLRVIIIDFNIAVIFRLTGGPRMEGNLPPSPIEHWSRRSVEFVDPGWIPRNRAEWGKWLFKHFGGSALYQPVTDTTFFDPPRSTPN